jgi:hypothetical protein
MGHFETSIYDEQNLKQSNFLNLYNPSFNFRSIYFLIQGLKVFLRVIFLPLSVILLFRQVAKLKKKTDQPKGKKTSFCGGMFSRLAVKAIFSLYLMTQLEAFIYAITSLRVSPTLLDVSVLVLNVGGMLGVQYLCYRIVKRKTLKSKLVYRLVNRQFIHLSKSARRDTIGNSKRCNLPVILL